MHSIAFILKTELKKINSESFLEVFESLELEKSRNQSSLWETDRYVKIKVYKYSTLHSAYANKMLQEQNKLRGTTVNIVYVTLPVPSCLLSAKNLNERIQRRNQEIYGIHYSL